MKLEAVNWEIPPDPVLWPPEDLPGRLSVVRAELERVLVDTRRHVFYVSQTIKNVEHLLRELEGIEKRLGHNP